MEFTSQICTTREQSERLLALGVKKETADCAHCYTSEEHGEYKFWDIVISDLEPYWDVDDESIPAWSLHRLLELCNVFYLGHRDYDSLINYLENLIKEDCFNKDYLKE